MAKAGMRRADPEAPHGTEGDVEQKFQRNTARPVPEIQGKAKTGKAKVKK
jgi:hypothetical protein